MRMAEFTRRRHAQPRNGSRLMTDTSGKLTCTSPREGTSPAAITMMIAPGCGGVGGNGGGEAAEVVVLAELVVVLLVAHKQYGHLQHEAPT